MKNDERVYTACISQGIPRALALLITAQSKHESANYTSSVFLDCNNSFGYKAVYGAPSCSGHSDYKYYPNIEASAIEVCGWLKRRVADGSFPPLNTISDPDNYAALLKNAGYYGDTVSNYAAGIKRWFTTNLTAISTGTILIIGAIFFL
jgi:hypothetical protein